MKLQPTARLCAQCSKPAGSTPFMLSQIEKQSDNNYLNLVACSRSCRDEWRAGHKKEKMETIKLTKRQREILICDAGADQPPSNDRRKSDYYGLTLGNELRKGSVVTRTTDLVDAVTECADHDADLNEQYIMKRLLRKLQTT